MEVFSNYFLKYGFSGLSLLDLCWVVAILLFQWRIAFHTPHFIYYAVGEHLILSNV